MTPEGFASWVESSRWQVAKTMPHTPHEYTVRAWDETDGFDEARQFILENGHLARWQHHRPKPYYEYGGRIYWAFDTVINRAFETDPGSEVVWVE